MNNSGRNGIIPLVIAIVVALAIILAVAFMLFQDVLAPLASSFGVHAIVIGLIIVALIAIVNLT